MVRGVSGRQQQQLPIEILTNLSIITYIDSRYYRESAALKQEARSGSRYIVLSSTVFIQTIA